MNKALEDVEKFILAVGQRSGIPSPITDDQCILYENLISEEYNELMEALSNEPEHHQCKELFDLIWVCLGYAQSRGWNFGPAWYAGTKSNLDKIDSKTGRVIRREDGKILKPDWWEAPDFREFV